MRHLIIAFVLFGVACFNGASSARDVNLQKHTVTELQAICQQAGGKFSQSANGYDCGTDCHGTPGTACVVFCKAGERCVAQVIGARRPRHALDALQGPKHHGG